MIKTLTIKSWGTRSHFALRGNGEQPFYAPAFFVMKYLLILCFLTSCTKEYSYEAPCVETTTTTWLDGVVIESSRNVDHPLRNDTSYSIGSVTPAVVVVKTVCK